MYKEFEQIVSAMIEAVLHFFKIHGEMIFGNSPVVIQNMFGKTPKAFDAVDMIFGSLVDHALRVIHFVVFAPALQGIVAPKLVGVVDRSFSRFLPYDGHELVSGDTLHNPRIDPSIALQKAKYNAFALRAASALSFAPAAKITFVHFNLARQFLALQFRHMIDCLAQLLVDSRYRLVVQPEVVGKFVCRLRLVEAFEDAEFPTELRKRFLFSAGLVSATNVAATSSIYFERTAENTLSASQKVGRTTENVLLSLRHMDILTPYGYVSP